jgi:hypothetical protein
MMLKVMAGQILLKLGLDVPRYIPLVLSVLSSSPIVSLLPKFKIDLVLMWVPIKASLHLNHSGG